MSPLEIPISPLETFAKEKLKITIWPKFTEIFEAFAPADGSAGDRKILIRSCNGAGKTTALAAICNWYFTTYPDSIVLTTASSWMQVKRNLWGEIRRQARVGKLFNRKDISVSPTNIIASEKHFMIGISPNVPENAMGFHAPHMLIAVDEATGINREIMTALLGNMSSANSQIVMICNPIDKDSFPYEAERSGEWKIIHISAFDHPNVEKNCEEIPGAVTREWIEDSVRSWSFEVPLNAADPLKILDVDWLQKPYRSTDLVQARILGEWAHLEASGFISLELIERNLRKTPFRFDEPHPDAAVEGATRLRLMGVDISRGSGGDPTIYAMFDVRANAPDIQRQFLTTYDDDLMQTADRIRHEYELCKAEGIELVIAIDDTGLGGGVTDKLRRDKIPVFPVPFSKGAKGFLPGKHIANTRAEMYFVLHQDLVEGRIQLLDLPRFHRELAAVRLDFHKGTGAYKMEDKLLTSKRLGHSPDYADATALARYALRLKKHEKVRGLL